jgi:hypothetical protein
LAGNIFPNRRRPGPEAGHSPSPIAEFNNEWSYNAAEAGHSLPPIAEFNNEWSYNAAEAGYSPPPIAEFNNEWSYNASEAGPSPPPIAEVNNEWSYNGTAPWHEQEIFSLYIFISTQNTTVQNQWSITQYNKLFFPLINASQNKILLSKSCQKIKSILVKKMFKVFLILVL